MHIGLMNVVLLHSD